MTHRDPEMPPRVIYVTDEIQAAMTQHAPVTDDMRALVARLLDKGRPALMGGKPGLGKTFAHRYAVATTALNGDDGSPTTPQGATPPAKKSVAPCYPAPSSGNEVTSS